MRQWIAIGAAVGLVAVSLPYVRAHDTQIAATAVFNGQVKTTGAGLDLNNPATRSAMKPSVPKRSSL